jgi:hypothetical protein
MLINININKLLTQLKKYLKYLILINDLPLVNIFSCNFDLASMKIKTSLIKTSLTFFFQ